MTERLLDTYKTSVNYGANDRTWDSSGSGRVLHQARMQMQMEMKEGVENSGFDGSNIEKGGNTDGDRKGSYKTNYSKHKSN